MSEPTPPGDRPTALPDTAPPDTTPPAGPTRALWVRGLLAALAAAAVNVVVFLLAEGAGVDFTVPDFAAGDGSTTDLVVAPVVLSSVLGAGAATVGRWVHLRWTRWPEAVFTVGVGVLALASLAQPFAAAPDMSPAGQLVLCLMHVVVAVAVLVLLGRRRHLVA